MADQHTLLSEPQADLFWTPFLFEQLLDLLPKMLVTAPVATSITALQRQIVDLFGTVTSQSSVALDLPADGGRMSVEFTCDCSDAFSCFLQRPDLVIFPLGSVVGSWPLRTSFVVVRRSATHANAAGPSFHLKVLHRLV